MLSLLWDKYLGVEMFDHKVCRYRFNLTRKMSDFQKHVESYVPTRNVMRILAAPPFYKPIFAVVCLCHFSHSLVDVKSAFLTSSVGDSYTYSTTAL